MASEPIKRFSAPQVLLMIAAFLIPWMGGQIATDRSLPLPSGGGSLFVSIFGGPILQGFETPLLSHFIIGLLIATAMAISLLKRNVIQLPNLKLAGLFIGFFGLLFISVGVSDFRFASMATLAEWLLYALAFFASVAILGRRDGPRLVLGALFVGICVIALYGIAGEYQGMRGIDPNYRIFAGWVNPNATAGIFLIGLCIGIGLIPSLEKGVALLTGVGSGLIATALFLTGSKAGMGAVVIAAAVFSLLALLWASGKKGIVRAGMAFLVLGIGFGLFSAIQIANQPKAGGGVPALGRLSTYNDTQAQSLGFRKLLWKGSLDLSVKRPTGYGLGTYKFEGSRPGLTTQTQLAHNNILQLAVESSWLSVGLLLAALILWLGLMFRGAKSMPEEVNLMRAGIVAALIGTFAHGIFESNFYYFGIGLTFFLLMGIGICLSADSAAPEFTPKGARAGLAVLCVLPILMLAYFGYAEYQRALTGFALQERDLPTAQTLTEGLVSIAPLDGEAWHTLSRLSPTRREEAIKNAARAMPSPRILRSLARFELERKKYASAEAAVNDALIRDPNNFNTLELGLQISQEFGDTPKAREYANRMIAVERTPYFQIRSLPQLVETATVQPRMLLAEEVKDPKGKIDLLQPALDMLSQYAQATVPEVKKFAAAQMTFNDETPDVAREKCETGIRLAKQLQDLYRLAGDTDKSTEAGGKIGLFEEAIASLAGGNK